MNMSDDEDDVSPLSPHGGSRLSSIVSLPPARSDSFVVELDVARGLEVEGEDYTQVSKPRKLSARRIEDLGWEADEESESDDEDDVDPRITLSKILEPEDFTFPTIAMSLLTPPASQAEAHSAPAAMESFPDVPSPSFLNIRKGNKEWFPMKSFMDLQGEEELGRWSWRSFIEVAKVS